MLCLDKVNALYNAFFGNPIKGTTFFKADTETDFNYIVDYIFWKKYYICVPEIYEEHKYWTFFYYSLTKYL